MSELPFWERIRRSFLSETDRAQLEREEREALRAAEPEPVYIRQVEKPFDIRNLSYDVRYMHTHILAPTGGGKTTLLENLILNDIDDKNRPSVVVIDPHSDLINRLVNLDLRRDPILITPDCIPSLNIFALNNRAAELNPVISIIKYLFRGFNIELSDTMDSLFVPLCNLLLSLPQTEGRNATLYDVVKFCRKPTAYAKAAEALPEVQREFFRARVFQGGFFNKTFEHVDRRVQGILNDDTLSALFLSENSSIDLYHLLNTGRLILIDTASTRLQESSAVFGRVFIALILRSVMERTVPESERYPTFLYVDEAGQYFDQKTEQLLTDARKFGLGCTFAHQYLHQLPASLKPALMGGTNTKFAASNVAAGEAAEMAREMRCTPQEITRKPPYHFTAYVRGQRAFEFAPEPNILVKQPQRTDLEAYLARNRAFIGADRSKTVQGTPPSITPQKPERKTDNYGEDA